MKLTFKKFKQILAILAIVVIILLYIAAFALSIMNNKYTDKFFTAALYSTFFVPVIIYLIIWIAGVLRSYNPNLPENKPENKNSH